jgi:hypothetical protein
MPASFGFFEEKYQPLPTISRPRHGGETPEVEKQEAKAQTVG